MTEQISEKKLEHSTADSVVSTNAEPSETIERKTHYERVLRESLRRVYIAIFLVSSEPFVIGTRYPFLYLYIQSIDPETTISQISILIVLASLLGAITTSMITASGDRFSHDRVYIFCILAAVIGLSIEAIANSFGMFIIGHIVGRVPNTPIAFAYIATVLPHKYAVRYCSITWSICSLVYLFSPIVGALIAEFMNYRAIFIFNAIFHVVFLVVCFFALNGSVKYLAHKQNLVGMIDGLDKDEQFPTCLRNKKESENKGDDDDDSSNIVMEYFSFWRSLPVYDLWMLLCSIMLNNISWSIEVIVTYYFLLFLVNVYGTTLLYGTFMLVQLTVIYGVITLIVPCFIKRAIPSYIWMMTFWTIILAITSILCTSKNNILELHWAYNFGIAVPFAIIGMLSEMCILELQPMEHAGKVTGLKGGMRDINRAVAVGMVGFFWNEPYNALWYGMATLSLIACLISVVMIMMIKCKKVPKQSSNDNDDIDVEVVASKS